ncbi:hypothetical protein [Lentzea sp. NPDC051838]
MKRLMAVVAITAGLLGFGAVAANAAEIRVGVGQRYSVIVVVDLPGLPG